MNTNTFRSVTLPLTLFEDKCLQQTLQSESESVGEAGLLVSPVVRGPRFIGQGSAFYS